MGQLIPIPSPGVPLAFGEAGAPLVVILPDWYGRLPWLEPYAEALADRGGFRVLVLDLYDGVATVDASEAERLADALDVETALGILGAAIDSERSSGSERVGLIGFSLGGGLALLSAQRGDADAVVAYYATLGSSPSGILPAPVLLHLAETDEFEPTDDAEAFIAWLRSDGTPVSAHTYAGTGHSFANATMVELVDARAAALAFARTTVFLESKLSD